MIYETLIDGKTQTEQIFEAIKILMELGEKDLAFRLRVAHDTHLRLGWKNDIGRLALSKSLQRSVK